MKEALDLSRAVAEAWANVPAPHLAGWRCTQAEADAFVDVRPMEVDINSVGFLAATPLLDLPREDPLTRAHIITCLKDQGFWDEVIRPHLSGKRLEVFLDVIDYMVRECTDLALDADDVRVLRARVSRFRQG